MELLVHLLAKHKELRVWAWDSQEWKIRLNSHARIRPFWMISSRVWGIRASLWMGLTLQLHQTRCCLITLSLLSMSVVSQPRGWAANSSEDLRVDSLTRISPEVTSKRTPWSRTTHSSKMQIPQVCDRGNRPTEETTSTSRTSQRAVSLLHHLRTAALQRLSGCIYARVSSRYHPHHQERRVDPKCHRVVSKPSGRTDSSSTNPIRLNWTWSPWRSVKSQTRRQRREANHCCDNQVKTVT